MHFNCCFTKCTDVLWVLHRIYALSSTDMNLFCVWQNSSISTHSQQYSEKSVYLRTGLCVGFLLILGLGLFLGRRKYFSEAVIQVWVGYIESQLWLCHTCLLCHESELMSTLPGAGEETWYKPTSPALLLSSWALPVLSLTFSMIRKEALVSCHYTQRFSCARLSP